MLVFKPMQIGIAHLQRTIDTFPTKQLICLNCRNSFNVRFGWTFRLFGILFVGFIGMTIATQNSAQFDFLQKQWPTHCCQNRRIHSLSGLWITILGSPIIMCPFHHTWLILDVTLCTWLRLHTNVFASLFGTLDTRTSGTLGSNLFLDRILGVAPSTGGSH